MRNQDLIAQQAFSNLQLGRISFSAVLMRPAVTACTPETGHTEKQCWCNMMQTSMALCPALFQDKPMSCLWQLQPVSLPQRHRLLLRKGGKGPDTEGILCTWDAAGEDPRLLPQPANPPPSPPPPAPTAKKKCSLLRSACK